jgi:hypothetical protein
VREPRPVWQQYKEVDKVSESLHDTAWLLFGYIQSLGGTLKLENERVSFEGAGEGLAGVPGFPRFSVRRLEKSAKRPGLA